MGHGTTTDRHADASAGAARPCFSIVCLSPQPWHIDLPTNRQQIMRRAADAGHPVLFVETGHFLGSHLAKLVRGPRRGSLARRLVRGEEVEPGVIARTCLNVLPWGQRYRLSNRVNGWVNRAALRRAARRLPGPRIVWLYDPTATWAAPLGAFAAYDCVDDYMEQAAGERNRLLVAEADRRAAEVARVVFATATPLFERHARTNPHTHLVRNVGDYAHFAPAVDRAIAREDLVDLPRPVVGFAGNFLGSKVDLDLLEAIAGTLEQGSLVLAGPASDPALAGRLENLASQDGVRWLGPVPYADLPSVVAAFDVGVIPYVANDYTRSCFPLKLYEYLAAGKPVVASGLPELHGMEPDVVVATGPEAFRAAVDDAVRLDGPAGVERRRAIARANTWEGRTARLLEIVGRELEA